MTKRPIAPGSESPASDLVQDGSPAPWLKIVLSVLLILHVAAVFAPPLAFACNAAGSSSPFADSLFGVLRPYIGVMYLDHGYFFFAPNPGPAHLVDYKVEFADSRPPIAGRFPDLKTERPRLLYHRYFMMSEALNNLYAPPDAPPEPTAPPITATTAEKQRFHQQQLDYQNLLASWKHRRRQYDSLWRAYEEHLQDAYGASKVTLTRVEHRAADPGEIEFEGKRLEDPASYTNLPESPPPAREALRSTLPAPAER
jgi:hypothetical protein